ncbi:hypothetical protein K7X08_012894 [Anisodus acutangulus]|uniref:Uncharacterized protein n=1 Tax=Anisodus acutangulus TaxID=402998 RepID=A0A9Q1MF03_9SOLA|nr:hypothetical protein K7X08_012894 [Anisodus acutangulus]
MERFLQSRQTLDVYVHILEEESNAIFNKGVGTSASRNIKVGEDAFNVATSSPNTISNTTPPLVVVPPNTQEPLDRTINLSDYELSDFSVKGSDESTENSPDSENGDILGDDDYFSDVHEEYIKLRSERREAQRRKRRERIPADTEEVSCSASGPDLGFDEIETSKKCLEGRLGGDEPYCPSSDDCSLESDDDEWCFEEGEQRRTNLSKSKYKKSATKGVRFDKTF